MKLIVFGVLLFGLNSAIIAQTGCTDPQAINYNVSAIINDGSCMYANTTLNTGIIAPLQTPLLDECSGLIATNGNVWMHVDDTDNRLFKMDVVTGDTLQSTALQATNMDWEDMDADSNSIYIGDIGNNSGNRTNLQFYKALISQLNMPLVSTQSITYSYADQVNFNPALNNTPWDAEAFFILNDSIHLFTKDWVTKYTKHYILPTLPGNYAATLVDSFNVGGLITSAAIDKAGTIVLLGYDNTIAAPCFLWMLYDYQPGKIFSGNKRKFNLGSAITLGQIEGITYNANSKGYITNERFTQLIINVPPALRSFDLSTYITTPTALMSQGNSNSLLQWDGQFLSAAPQKKATEVVVFNMYGHLCAVNKLFAGNKWALDFLPAGIYLIKMIGGNDLKALKIFKP
ncbi:MAG: T9SS type A sorting domain-containing protein [Bacteroidia bacterium]|nr:T9SS type A sorting domain-containing protein [Bacteroidia bacterium]